MNFKCGWQIILAFIAVRSVIADLNNEVFLDLMNTEDNNIVIWQNLLINTNKILMETTKLSENMENLHARQNILENHMLDLKKGHNNLENQMLDLKKGQNNQENQLSDLKKGLEEQKVVAIQTLESVQEKFNILDQGQTELNKATVQIMQTMHQHSKVLKNIQTEQYATFNQLEANEDIYFKELEKKQDEYTNATNQFMEYVQKHFKNLEQGQTENIHNLTSLMNPWITILRRQDGSVNFNRNWREYKTGFGNANGEFFIGLDNLHAMTNEGDPKELVIVLRDFEDEGRYAKYDLFRIGNENEKYILKQLGAYSGNAGDSLINHKGMKFSTYDQDNDNSSRSNCANFYDGGWWYASCYNCNLGGQYQRIANIAGVAWNEWKGNRNSLKFAEMKIRSKFS